MKPNHILLGIAFICIVIASVLYFYAYSHDQYRTPLPTATSTQASSTASTKVAAASIADGTYSVHVHSIMSSSEDTTITFSRVTYFEGAEASSSASQDVKCPNKPIQACVPTLTRGFYARPSELPDFTAPVPEGTPIVLRDASHATIKALRNMTRDFEPVFDVVIKDGNVLYLTEKSPL